jgi:hypothetical protein
MIKDSVKRLDRALNNRHFQTALSELLNQWLQASCIYTAATTDLKELTYLKTKIVTEEGGEYFMSFMHVDGPKIKLREGDTDEVKV